MKGSMTKKNLARVCKSSAHAILTARGHDAKSGEPCRHCGDVKPERGGWNSPCPGDKRIFMGG